MANEDERPLEAKIRERIARAKTPLRMVVMASEAKVLLDTLEVERAARAQAVVRASPDRYANGALRVAADTLETLQDRVAVLEATLRKIATIGTTVASGARNPRGAPVSRSEEAKLALAALRGAQGDSTAEPKGEE